MSWSEAQKKTDEILSKFERSLSGSKYKLIKHYLYHNRYGSVSITGIDGLITTEQGYPYCIIEIRPDLQDFYIDLIKDQVVEDSKKMQSKFAIITDGKKYLFFEYPKDEDFKDKEYDEIIEKILPSSKEEKDLNTDPTTYLDLIRDYFNNTFNTVKIENNDICFDNNKFSIKTNKEEELVEKLFNTPLFKSDDFFPEDVFYRYTSLNTVFEILRDREIKMFGIAAMNDASEVNYIEKNIVPSGAQPLNPEINKIFIMSCSLDKDDDLTQWRLYGDDAKGVCLKFKVKEKTTPFVIRKIEYLAETSEQISKLKDLVKHVYDKTGYAFIFNAIHEWCHFIKPENFKEEREVRVLYKSSDDFPDLWVLANSTNIINPYVKFNFEDFPLKLTEIKLGPKCPDPIINKFQLETLLKNIPNLKDTEVSLSAIKNYR